MEVITTLKQYYDEIKDKGYTPFCVSITGSQCYNLADDKSDVDAVAFVLPSWHDICFGRPYISEQLDMSTGAHCTLIDIRKLSKLFDEGDFIHYIPLYCDTYVPPEFVEDFQTLTIVIDELASFNKGEILRKAMGMCQSNLRKIERKTAETCYWDSSCGKYYTYIRWLEKFIDNLWYTTSKTPWYLRFEYANEFMLYKRGKLQLLPESACDHAREIFENMYKKYVTLIEELHYEPNWVDHNPLMDWQETFIYNYYWRKENV